MNKYDKEKLIEKDIKSVENRIRHVFNQGYEAGLKHGEEQEPLTDVLDKIIKEIEQYHADCYLSCDDVNCKECNHITFGSILLILDKYRKESEDKNDSQS